MCTSYVKFNCVCGSIKCAYKYFQLVPPLHFYELRAEKRPKNGKFLSISKKTTIIEVTDSHTTGIASARTPIILITGR